VLPLLLLLLLLLILILEQVCYDDVCYAFHKLNHQLQH
jgi:hypothetical protein